MTITPSTLPAGWSFDELGAPPIPGSVSVADGRFTLTGCGGPAYQWDSRPSTASGLMLRESLTEAVAVTRSSRSKPLASSSSAGATRSDQTKAA